MHPSILLFDSQHPMIGDNNKQLNPGLSSQIKDSEYTIQQTHKKNLTHKMDQKS